MKPHVVFEYLFSMFLGFYLVSYALKLVTTSFTEFNISHVAGVLTYIAFVLALLLGSRRLLPDRLNVRILVVSIAFYGLMVSRGEMNEASLTKTIDFVGATIPCVLFGRVLVWRDLSEWFTASLLFLGVVAAAFNVINWFFEAGAGTIGRYVVVEDFSHVGFATLMGFCTVVSINGLLANGESTRKLLLYGFSFVLFIIAIVTTGTRGALLFSIGTSIVIYRKHLFRRKAVLLYVILISLASVLLFGEFLGEQLAFFYERTMNIGYEDASLYRLAIYAKSIETFIEHPIFGYGLTEEYPHNLFLEVGVEYGLVGLALLAMMLIVIVKKSRAIAKTSHLFNSKLSISLFLYTSLISMVSMTYSFNRWWWFSASSVISIWSAYHSRFNQLKLIPNDEEL